MNTSAQLTAPAVAGVSGALQRIVSGLHWLRIAHAERRRLARRQREYAQLDQHALRDLGLTRGELDSYSAEARGAVARTRLRVFDDGSTWWIP
jgi:uncharacterized protein YjiS (DUF1127 family)